MEQVDQLHPHPLDDLIGGDPGGRELRNTVNPPEVVPLLHCHLLMVATAGGQLGHDDPDDEEAYRGLYVRALGDRQPLVGFGEEEVEPQSDGDRGEVAGRPVAEHRDADHCGDEHERRRRAGKIRPEGNQRGGEPQGYEQ
jgi:hypothetical protein